jgi:hypothetical protein
MLDRLVLADGPAEDHPLLGILRRPAERGAADSDGLGPIRMRSG